MIHENQPLKDLNTFGLDVKARFLASFSSLEELQALERESAFQGDKMVLGGGSNVLFTQDYPGLILLNQIEGVEVVQETEQEVIVRVGAGMNWHNFVLYAIKQQWAGIENLSLIPGSVGASPIQNIGAYGVELKDVFVSLEAYHLERKEVIAYDKDTCAFGYRDSIFKRELKGKVVILSVTFQLNKEPQFNTSYGNIEEELKAMAVEQLSTEAISEAVVNIRSRKLPDPNRIGNAGSFFKNPVIGNAQFKELKAKHPNIPGYPVEEDTTKVPAGWLIEQAGWKGKRRDTHGVHDKQALVLVNHGGALGQEVYQLSEDILQDVQAKFNISLEREVNII